MCLARKTTDDAKVKLVRSSVSTHTMVKEGMLPELSVLPTGGRAVPPAARLSASVNTRVEQGSGEHTPLPQHRR